MSREGLLRALVLGIAILTFAVPVAATAQPSSGKGRGTVPGWRPEPARYGVATTSNVNVTMSDGAVLQADVSVPTDPRTGRPARGRFPVLLVQTPYGKSGDVHSYFVKRGYIEAEVDIRGRGSSEGTYDPFGPQSVRDSVELVHWAARLPDSTHTVGTWGGSFLGIDQLMTAEAVGPRSPLKATFPIVASNSNYRDLTLAGGVYNGGFTTPYTVASGLGDGMTQPVTETDGNLPRTAQVLAQHGTFAFDPTLGTQIQINGGYGAAYDDQWWRARSVAPGLARIVASDVPTLLVGGWYDLFQRGETVNYAALQNAFANRRVVAPMRPGQPVSPKYQLVMGPWFHDVAGGGTTPQLDLDRLALEWFDTWLKHENTGLQRTTTPLHLYENKGGRWLRGAYWPPPTATATAWYFAAGRASSGSASTNDGVLTTRRPRSGGSDPLVFTAGGSPCNKQTDLQLANALGGVPGVQTCTEDARTTETGPGALTYTTPVLDHDLDLAGPMNVRVYLTSTRPEALLYAALEDVGPDGRADVVTYGQQVASMRAFDRSRSWYWDRQLIAPYHYFTQRTAEPLVAGRVVAVDVELYGTLTRIAKGHRLRLLVASSASHLSPGAAMTGNLLGGVYAVQRTATAASRLTLMSADPHRLASSRCGVC